MSATTQLITPGVQAALVRRYQKAKERLLLLDYDGTLLATGLTPTEETVQHQAVRQLLRSLTRQSATTVVIVSGRDHLFLQKRFQGLRCVLAAEHGLWIKDLRAKWQKTQAVTAAWKPEMQELFSHYADNPASAFFEAKQFSLVWYYRNPEQPQVQAKMNELHQALLQYSRVHDFRVIRGQSLLEILPATVNKGRTAQFWLKQHRRSLVVAAGDDVTDEDMFSVLPKRAISIKVQSTPSAARYRLPSWMEFRALLQAFSAQSKF